MHLDLIAGLPNENLSSFSASFDEVMYLRPHVLQLGFLKLLKGSKIRQRANDYQYKFISEPPYEILENSDLTYDEIVLLKSVEDVLEKYYNSGAFIKTLEFVLSSLYSSCFDFFRDLAVYFNKYGLNRRSHSQKALYDILYEFYRANKERMRHSGGSSLDVENRLFREYLKFDFVNNQPGSFLPYWSNHTSDKGFREACFEFLKNRESIGKYLPYHIDESAKKLIKKVDFAIFNFGKNVDCFQVFLFDRISKKAYEVTQDWNGSVHSN